MNNTLLIRWLRALSRLFPRGSGLPYRFTGFFSGRLRRQIEEEVTDELLGILLWVMDVAFALSRDFRRHINGFHGRYVFATVPSGSGSHVAESVVFEDGDMIRSDDAIADYHVKVSFADPAALRSYILSTDQDILDLMLENKVTVEGNVNYIYKFLYMSKDLIRRIGLGSP